MGRWHGLLGLAILALAGPAARAQGAGDRPVGPCSPIAGPDGDIASELPGCLRHRRPPEGSLADEMAFRRRRDRIGAPGHPAGHPPGDEPE